MPNDKDADDPAIHPQFGRFGSAAGSAPVAPPRTRAEGVRRARDAAEQFRRERGLPELPADEHEDAWAACWRRKGRRRR